MTDFISATAPAATAGRAATGTTETNAGASSSQSAVLSSDFETFLRMLTAQVQNQDPMNPLDSTDFAVQLATFSNVEQQVRTNVLLQDLGENMGATGSLTEMAGYVGKEALVNSPPRYARSPLEFETSPHVDAVTAELRVYDDQGRPLDRQEINPKGGTVTWTGERRPDQLPENPSASDKYHPAGNYAYEVVSFDARFRIIDISTPESFVGIAEARRNGDQLQLKLSNNKIVAESDILALRDP